MKKLLRFLASRTFWAGALVLLETAALAAGIFWLRLRFPELRWLCVLLRTGLALFAATGPGVGAYKLLWTLTILGLPGVGGLLFLLFSRRGFSRQKSPEKPPVPSPVSLPPEAREDPAAVRMAACLAAAGPFPPFPATETRYLTPGESKFRVLCQELEKARRFIFLEYFILEPGVMWDKLLAILTRKAREGVEIRLLYDAVGCCQTLPPGYPEKLRRLGIQVRSFNPLRPYPSARSAWRDHRKLCIIDGTAAITGGANLADEYINVRKKHGYWKDAALLLRGPGAAGFCPMFQSLWDGEAPAPAGTPGFGEGTVIPFWDSPADRKAVSRDVYLQMIRSARRTLRIQTPYLILDEETAGALALAARSGVRVEIFTPGIGDRRAVQELTRANYPRLLRAGVEIYEYVPGFLHSKVVAADGTSAVVGSANFDFRSLFLLCECGVWMHCTAAVDEVEADFRELRACSVPIRESKVPWYRALIRRVLEIFAPLL